MSTFLPSNTRCELCSCIFTHVTVYNPRWCIRSVVLVSGLFFPAPLQPAPARARARAKFFSSSPPERAHNYLANLRPDGR